eukprot:tig00020675_g12696.t1
MVAKLRLGYACINELLKEQDIRANRTLVLKTIHKEGVQEAKRRALANVADLKPILEWNERHEIRFFRLGSDLFPFASHKEVGYDVSFAAAELREVGDLAKRLGHRLTSHPGQYNNLTSPESKIVENSIRELQYHADVFDLMGLDADSVMVLHGGGAYGDKKSALERFERNFQALPPSVARRLVLENDDKVYNVEDLLPLCDRLEIPLVLDWHHDKCLPSSQPIAAYLDDIARTWTRRGIRQKQHQSESAPGANPCAHSDYVEELPALCLGTDVDLMIEAKMKEQAVLHLYRKNPWLIDGGLWARLDAERAWPEVNGFRYGEVPEGEEGDEDECERAERYVEKDEEEYAERRRAKGRGAGAGAGRPKRGKKAEEVEAAPAENCGKEEEEEEAGRGRRRTRARRTPAASSSKPAKLKRRAAAEEMEEGLGEGAGAPARRTRARTVSAAAAPAASRRRGKRAAGEEEEEGTAAPARGRKRGRGGAEAEGGEAGGLEGPEGGTAGGRAALSSSAPSSSGEE